MAEISTYIIPLIAVLAGFYLLLLGQGVKIGPDFLKGKETARVIAVVLVLGGSFKLMFTGPADAPEAAKQEKPVHTAAEIVAEMKKRRPLPVQIDANSTLVALEAEDKKITYTVTIADKGEISYQKADAIIRELPKKACEDEHYTVFLKMGVTIDTKYINGDDKHVGTVSITPERCGY